MEELHFWLLHLNKVLWNERNKDQAMKSKKQWCKGHVFIRDGNLNPSRGYPARSDPNGPEFT